MAPEEKPEAKKAEAGMLSKEEAEAMVQEARKGALAQVSQLQRDSALAIKAAQATQERLNRVLQEQEARELETARDDPASLTMIQERQKRRQAEAENARLKDELNQREARLQELDAERGEITRNRSAQEIAQRVGVDPVLLSKLARSSDGTPEAIEDIAKSLPQKEAKPLLRVDSGAMTGGNISFEQARDAYIKNPRGPGVAARYLEMRRERQRG